MAYIPRLTAPDPNDPRQLQINYGGYNQCIVGSDGPPSVLPNCTGYVHFRVMELRNVNTDDCGLSFGNAVTYWTTSSSNWIQDQNPSLGAVVCYRSLNVTGQPGHVAIVEEIIDNDTIVVSESDYGDPANGIPGTRFRTLTCYRANGWRFPGATDVYAQGFLRNPYVQPGGRMKPAVMMLLLSKMKERRKANARIQRNSGIL